MTEKKKKIMESNNNKIIVKLKGTMEEVTIKMEEQ